MKYRIEFGGESLEFRASRVNEFRDAVIYAVEENTYLFFVDGVSVSRDDALAACAAAIQAKWDKKSETHKRVRVSVGATTCGNTYRSKWVRK